MNNKIRLLATTAAAVLSSSAFAQNGTWTNLSDSIWGDATNWLNGVIATGSGNTADFSTSDQPSTRTVLLETSRTIGGLSFGDTDTNTPASWILAQDISGGQVLTLAGSSPVITVGGLAPGNFAELQNTNAGTAGFTKLGPGELRLTGVNTLTGQININEGRLYLLGGNFAGGTLPLGITNNLRNGSTLSIGNSINNVFVPAGHTGTIEQRTGVTMAGLGGGAGSILNVELTASGGTITAAGSWWQGGRFSAINVNSTGGTMGFWRLRPNGNPGLDTLNSFSNTVINLDRINMWALDNSGGNTFNIGAINGTTNAIWRGAQNGAANYIVGWLNQDMLFEGTAASEAAGFSGFNLRKVGTGTLTFSGTNITYGGDQEAIIGRRGGFTTIDTGTLALTNGASLGRGIVGTDTIEYFHTVIVNANGTYEVTGTTNNTTSPLTMLRGTGKIKGNYVHDEAVLSPADSLVAGTLTFLNDLTITNNPSIDPNTLAPYALVTSNSTIRFDISPSLTSGNDVINVAGTAYVDGNPDVEVNFLGGASPGSYTLINATNGVVGNPSSWNVKWGGRGAAPTVTTTANKVLLNVSLGGSANLVWQGGISAVWDVNTTSNWLNGAFGDKFFQLDSVTFNESLPSQTAVTLSTIVTPSSMTVSNDGTTYSISGAGQIGGGGSLTKRGTGLFTLTTANTFSGGSTVMDGGILDAGGTVTALGTGPVTLNGGTLQMNHGGALNINNPIILTAGTTNVIQANGGGTTGIGTNISGGASGQLTLASDAAVKGIDWFGDSSALGGYLTMSTAVNLRFRTQASGNLAAVNVDLGFAGSVLSSKVDNTPVTYHIGALSGAAGSVLDGHASSVGGEGAHVTWQIGALGLDTTFDGIIRNGNQAGGSNVTSLVKVGAGKLTLTGMSTYTGDTTVSAGTLSISQPYIAKTSTVNIGAVGKLEMTFADTNYVAKLFINGVQQPNGTYGAAGSGAANIDNTHFSGTGVLWVGAPPAPALSSSLNGSQLTLDWPVGPGWRLQSQTNSLSTGLSTNWSDVTGATPPYVTDISPEAPAVFFRLVYP